MTDALTKFMQENLIVLLSFNDDVCRTIRNTIPADMFEATYRDVATRVYEYIDKYGAAPKEQLADLFEDKLEGEDNKEYEGLLIRLWETNSKVDQGFIQHTLDRLNSFTRQQDLKRGVLDAAKVLQQGREDAHEVVEGILGDVMKRKIDLFDPGVQLRDPRALEFLEERGKSFITGIPAFDDKDIGPTRGGLDIFIGLGNRGKSWWLINLGKRAIMSRKKVLHVTLEMPDWQVLQRYFQALFAMAKRDEESPRTEFEFDEYENLIGFDAGLIKPRLAMSDPTIRDKLKRRLDKFGTQLDNLIVKQFPTGRLTLREFDAYLDALEISKGFVPDIILLDYIDLMSIGTDNYRLDLSTLVKDIRGLAVERNVAIATVSQSNRAGLDKKKLTEGNLAEDFSKMGTADVVITYNQTDTELKYGLARLYVAKSRGDERGFTVLITQNYATGQFVLDSYRMNNEGEYFKMFEADDS